jgi:hypothetical protein
LEVFTIAERDEAASSMQMFVVHHLRGKDESTLYEGFVSKVMIEPAPTGSEGPQLLAVSFVGERCRVVTVTMELVVSHKLSGRIRAPADELIAGDRAPSEIAIISDPPCRATSPAGWFYSPGVHPSSWRDFPVPARPDRAD